MYLGRKGDCSEVERFLYTGCTEGKQLLISNWHISTRTRIFFKEKFILYTTQICPHSTAHILAQIWKNYTHLSIFPSFLLKFQSCYWRNITISWNKSVVLMRGVLSERVVSVVSSRMELYFRRAHKSGFSKLSLRHRIWVLSSNVPFEWESQMFLSMSFSFCPGSYFKVLLSYNYPVIWLLPMSSAKGLPSWMESFWTCLYHVQIFLLYRWQSVLQCLTPNMNPAQKKSEVLIFKSCGS